MKVKLIKQTIMAEGFPLKIKDREFSGTPASIVSQVKEYVAKDVIPRVPFFTQDDDARDKVRKMSNAELEEALVSYINTEKETNYPVPKTDAEAIQTFAKAGFLVVLEQ